MGRYINMEIDDIRRILNDIVTGIENLGQEIDRIAESGVMEISLPAPGLMPGFQGPTIPDDPTAEVVTLVSAVVNPVPPGTGGWRIDHACSITAPGQIDLPEIALFLNSLLAGKFTGGPPV